MNEYKNKKIAKACIVITVIAACSLAILVISQFVSAYDLATGDSVNVLCSNCTIWDVTPIHIKNNTVQFTCEDQLPDYDVVNGTCTIDKHLEDGENYAITDGPCDLNLTCGTGYGGNYMGMTYPGIISLIKDQNRIKIQVNVTDPNGEEVVNWKKDLEQNDILNLQYPFNYICPHEVITSVNMQTCAEYLDPILGEQNPLIYSLATAQNNCTNQLMQSISEKTALSLAMTECQIRISQMTEDNENCHAQKASQYDELNRDIDELENEYLQYKLDTVSVNWMYAFVVALIIIVLIGFSYLFGGEEMS